MKSHDENASCNKMAAAPDVAERDCFKQEFKRYKKKSTDLREVLDVRNPEHLKLFKGIGA